MKEMMISVGIDIGTSTTQLVFCQMGIENTASAWTVPTVKIVEKKVLYRSPIYFTPLKTADTIDAEAVRDIINKIYADANMQPNMVDTGAVIITGETARKENAEDVLSMLSGLAGDFVVATAGPDLEGILAGKGSGAWEYSKNHSCTTMNFDIGGGTTNVAVYRNGEVLSAGCYDIGGRLIKVDENQRVHYLSKKMNTLIEVMKVDLHVGTHFSEKMIQPLADAMAQTMVDIAERRESESKYHDLLVTNHPLNFTGKIDAVFFSGGVADCVHSDHENLLAFNDIGIVLGRSIRKAFKKSSARLIHAEETIRATVIGAGTHTTDISGSTIHYDVKKLPLKNIPIIKMSVVEEGLPSYERVAAIRNRLTWFWSQSDKGQVALALRGDRKYGYDLIQKLAKDIVEGMKPVVDEGLPLIVLVHHDLAKSLGLSLRGNLSPESAVICIDSVTVDNGDYIDIGLPVADGQVVPVIIKTLLFGY